MRWFPIAVLLAVFPAVAAAQPGAVMLHVAPYQTTTDPCSLAPTSAGDIVTEGQAGEGGDYFVYILGTSNSSLGVAGIRTGIEYSATGKGGKGMVVHDWTACSFLYFPSGTWPASGSGNTMTWDTEHCPHTNLVAGGYFYVTAYSPSTMAVVGYPNTGQVQVADCQVNILDAAPLNPVRLGWVALETTGGCNPLTGPCDKPAPAEPATWGAIKAKFGSNP
jgi:hypothetical protein